MAISFYLRKYGTSSFFRLENPVLDEKLVPIKTDAVEHTEKVFCPLHKEWENVSVSELEGLKVVTSCGKILEGFPVEIPKFPLEGRRNIKDCLQKLESLKKSAEGLRKIPQKILSNYMMQKEKLEILRVENGNFYDDAQCKKDIIGFQLDTNEKLLVAKLDYFMLDRKIIDSSVFNPKITPPCKRYTILLKMGECGKTVVPSEQNANEFYDWREERYVRQKCEEISFDSMLPQDAMAQIHALLNAYAGRSVTLNTVLKGELLLQGLCDYPYEPNMIVIENYRKTILGGFPKSDRISSDVYNKVCDYLKIKSYPTLRRLFYVNPMVLLVYRLLTRIGFKDLNIINTVLNDSVSNASVLRLLDFAEAALVLFANFLLGGHAERTVWYMLWKMLGERELNFTDANDGIEMFAQYFNYIDDEMKKSVMKDGMTLYNHDMLAKFSLDFNNRDLEFLYTDDQLALEDEIDGYHFELAKNSGMLRMLGSKLHNCVASYTQRVAGGKCIVVFAHVEGVPKLCIELRENIVWQQRADRNENPEGKDLLVLKKWEAKHNLVFIENRY
ncbi:MAG: PcfJ domain-containing protein [Treponema sp.]|nr:PcfJ domain-containing protein [Treponema sp.]